MSPAMRRDSAATAALNGEKLGLPMRPFLWTLDQVATMLNMGVPNLKASYVYFEGRSTGPRSVHLLVARNIAKPDATPEWRIAEMEVKRWLKTKGFKFYEPSQLSY